MTTHTELVDNLRRRIDRLEKDREALLKACEFVARTLDLHRDKTANPLAKMADRGIAERMVREAVAQAKGLSVQ